MQKEQCNYNRYLGNGGFKRNANAAAAKYQSHFPHRQNYPRSRTSVPAFQRLRDSKSLIPQ